MDGRPAHRAGTGVCIRLRLSLARPRAASAQLTAAQVAPLVPPAQTSHKRFDRYLTSTAGLFVEMAVLFGLGTEPPEVWSTRNSERMWNKWRLPSSPSPSLSPFSSSSRFLSRVVFINTQKFRFCASCFIGTANCYYEAFKGANDRELPPRTNIVQAFSPLSYLAWLVFSLKWRFEVWSIRNSELGTERTWNKWRLPSSPSP